MCCSAHGRVHAIVRARSGDEARERLRGSFNTGDAELLELFDSLSKDHLSVHAGAALAHILQMLQSCWSSTLAVNLLRQPHYDAAKPLKTPSLHMTELHHAFDDWDLTLLCLIDWKLSIAYIPCR